MTNADLEITWREMHTPLLAFIRGRVGDPRDAEDVLQDVMLRIHRHAGDVDQVENFSAWIYRIARNAVIDLHRRRAARPEQPAGDAAELIEAAPSDQAIPDDARDQLARCLKPLVAQLGDQHREALELVEFGGMSQVAAADQLGLSNSGMKTRVQRARRELREQLLECCHIELASGGGIATYEARPGGCRACGKRSS